MSMTPGSVTVNDNESHTGDGLALALYLATKAAHKHELANPAAFDEPPWTNPPPLPETASEEVKNSILSAKAKSLVKMKEDAVKMRLDTLRRWALDATVIGATVVTYLQAHAVVSLADVKATVDTVASVGRLPATSNPGDPIDGPAAPVDLPVTGAAAATTLALL